MYFLRNAKKSVEKITQMERELRELEEKLREMNDEKKTLTADGSYMERELETVNYFPPCIYRYNITGHLPGDEGLTFFFYITSLHTGCGWVSTVKYCKQKGWLFSSILSVGTLGNTRFILYTI